MYLCICVFVYLHICGCVLCICVFVYLRICVLVYLCFCVFVFVYLCISICILMHVSMLAIGQPFSQLATNAGASSYKWATGGSKWLLLAPQFVADFTPKKPQFVRQFHLKNKCKYKCAMYNEKTGGSKWFLLAPQFVQQFHSKKRKSNQLNQQTKH